MGKIRAKNAQKSGYPTATGITAGLLIGVVLGLLLENLLIGMALGIAFGAGLEATSWLDKYKSKNKK